MKYLALILFIGFVAACGSFPEIADVIPSDDAENSVPADTNPGTTANSDTSVPANETEKELPGPEPMHLVINEVYYDAAKGDTDGELFVELAGTPDSSLAAYQIRFVNGDDGNVTETIDFSEQAWTGENGLFVVADGRTGALDTTQVALYDWIDNFDPQNGPDGVQLINRSGELLDTLVYGAGAVKLSSDGLPLGEGDFAEDVSGGWSLSRDEASTDTDNNAVDFLMNAQPSPGSLNVILLLP